MLTAILIAPPTLFYAWLVRRIDRFEKEPAKYVFAAFLWGAVPSAVLAIIVQLVFSVPTTLLLGDVLGNAIATALYAPVTEEIIKGLAVAAIYFWRRREFDGWVDGIVYGSTVGFGFAYIENILYLESTSTPEEWVELFFLRVLVLGFMHGFWTSLTGLGFGFARHAKSSAAKALFILGGLSAAIAAHAIHNGSLVIADMTGDTGSLLITALNYGVLIALMLGLGVVARAHDREMFQDYLKDEVPTYISEAAYQALSKGQYKSSALPKPAAAFCQLAAELAQRKYQQHRHGEDHQSEVDVLRAKLKVISYPQLREQS